MSVATRMESTKMYSLTINIPNAFFYRKYLCCQLQWIREYFRVEAWPSVVNFKNSFLNMTVPKSYTVLQIQITIFLLYNRTAFWNYFHESRVRPDRFRILWTMTSHRDCWRSSQLRFHRASGPTKPHQSWKKIERLAFNDIKQIYPFLRIKIWKEIRSIYCI